MKNLWLLTSFAALALTSCNSAPSVYTLRIKAKEGDTFPYTMTVEGTNMGVKKVMSMDSTVKVSKVAGKETTFVTTVDGMSMDGKPAPAPLIQQLKSQPTTEVKDELGKILNSNDQSSGLIAMYSEKPVKVGDTWQSGTSINGKKSTLSFRFVAVEPQAGKESAHLEATLPTDAPIKLRKPIQMWVETATGMLTRLEIEGTQGKGARANDTVKMTMTRR